MRGPSYLSLTRSISWLLMPWLLTSPGHQQPWYWLCRIGRFLSYMRKDFNYLRRINVEKWQCKYMFMFPLKNLARKGLICHCWLKQWLCIMFFLEPMSNIFVTIHHVISGAFFYWHGLTPLWVNFFHRKRKNVSTVYIIPPLWHDTSSWNPFLCKQELTYSSQYQGCWCPGDARSQDISNHDIDYVKPG